MARMSTPILLLGSIRRSKEHTSELQSLMSTLLPDTTLFRSLVGIGYQRASGSLSTGGSLLHLAAWSDSRSVALFLLQQGADPNDSSGTGATPLMVAAMEGRWHMVELLLEHGADVNAHTPDRLHTALSYSMIDRKSTRLNSSH